MACVSQYVDQTLCLMGELTPLSLTQVPRHVMSAKPWVAEKFEEALEVIKSLGATIVDSATFPEWTLQFYENHQEEMEFSFYASFRNSKPS